MSQRRIGVLITCLALVCTLFIALPAFADSNARIVRLSYINGDAQINHNDKDEGFSHALLNMPVTSGMWLYTPTGARAEVQFENGNTVRLVEDAQIQFEKLALANSGAKIDTINIDHGIVYLNFPKVDKGDQIHVNFAGTTMRIAKSARLRLEISDKIISIAALHGQATLDGGFNVEIKDGHTVLLNPENTDQFKVVKGTDSYGTDGWDKNRDDELAAQSATHGNGMLSTNSMFNAQYASLGSYGNFLSVPGYGSVWQPNGMGPGWDPFMNGVWGFYPGMGYMFISSSPWGWMPYRYGQWNFNPAYGWFWAPGATMTAFNVGPNYGAVPAGWHAPAQPVSGGAVRNQYVVVGHPANVHPAILQGHANLNTHPAPRAMTPVRNMSMNQRGMAGQNNAANRGMGSSPNPRSSAAAHGGATRSVGPAMHSSGPAMSGASHSAGSVGGMGGHPK